MPSGAYIRTLINNKHMSDVKKGKLPNHKSDCHCGWCKALRKESLSKEQALLISKALKGKPRMHILNCKCPFCKSKRGELFGINHPKFGKSSGNAKGCWFDVPNQGKVWLRSLYELIFAKYLVAKQVDFRYEYKRFILDAKTFLPDFYLIKENKFIEVKGWVKTIDLQKMKEMGIFYPDVKIEMVTKKEIDEIRINN